MSGFQDSQRATCLECNDAIGLFADSPDLAALTSLGLGQVFSNYNAFRLAIPSESRRPLCATAQPTNLATHGFAGEHQGLAYFNASYTSHDYCGRLDSAPWNVNRSRRASSPDTCNRSRLSCHGVVLVHVNSAVKPAMTCTLFQDGIVSGKRTSQQR